MLTILTADELRVLRKEDVTVIQNNPTQKVSLV